MKLLKQGQTYTIKGRDSLNDKLKVYKIEYFQECTSIIIGDFKCIVAKLGSSQNEFKVFIESDSKTSVIVTVKIISTKELTTDDCLEYVYELLNS